MSKHEIWRYIPGGKVKHALAYAEQKVAACGASPGWWSAGWYGTGSQTECEELAARPPCRRCVARGYRP